MKIRIDGVMYAWETGTLTLREAVALQLATGMTMKTWQAQLEDGDAIALAGLVWLVKRRNGENVPFDEVDCNLPDLDIEDDEPDPTEAGDGAPADEATTTSPDATVT